MMGRDCFKITVSGMMSDWKEVNEKKAKLEICNNLWKAIKSYGRKMALVKKKRVDGLELHFSCRIFRRAGKRLNFIFLPNYVLLKLLFKLVGTPTAAQKHPN